MKKFGILPKIRIFFVLWDSNVRKIQNQKTLDTIF
jgi:hypothetical protein